jgi:molybdopterin molybdotransferase
MDHLERIRETVLASCSRLAPERVPLARAAGRWLAAPLLAVRAAPPQTCSAMDGYAVRAADVAGEAALPIALTVYAGDAPPGPLAPGTAARVFTGAPLPEGADAVVREEQVREEGGRAAFARPARPGENVRLAGEDVPRGGEALPAGVRLGARQLALAAAVAAGEVEVVRRPRAAIVATGDEVVGGRTPDSNGPALAAALAAAGLAVERRQVGDEIGAVAAELGRALESSDAVVTVGGVSVGVRDHVPAAVERLGGQVLIHGVPMKPGKPFLFGLVQGKPLLGLPGSPSACLVAFEVFARPALLKLAGASRLLRRRARLPLAEPVEGRVGRARFLWARLEGDGRVRPVGRDAAQVRGPALADALLHLPEGTGSLAEGEAVEAWLLEDDG